MPFGQPGSDHININIDSLWSGGPFISDLYNGGNPATEKYSYLPEIRENIFLDATGNVIELLGGDDFCGSNSVLGNFSVTIDGVTSWSNYNRTLDLNNGLHTTTYTANDGAVYTVMVYFSYPDQVCVYNLSSSAILPMVTIELENLLLDTSLVNSTCGTNLVRVTGVTQLGPPTGMEFEAIARLATPACVAYCSNSTTGTLAIPAESNIRTISFVIDAGTNHDQTKGNAARNFSFKGMDPGLHVEAVASSAAAKAVRDLWLAHMWRIISLSPMSSHPIFPT